MPRDELLLGNVDADESGPVVGDTEVPPMLTSKMVLAVVSRGVDGEPPGELVVAESVVELIVEPSILPGLEPEEDPTGLMAELVGVTKLELDGIVSAVGDTTLDEAVLWKPPSLVDALCATAVLPVIGIVIEVEEELVSWKVVAREVESLEDRTNVVPDNIGF